MAAALTLAAGWLASGLVVIAPPAPAPAAAPTHIYLLDLGGNRTRSWVVEADPINLFDVRSNRMGSGRIEDRRRGDSFDDVRSNRTGSGGLRGGAVETFDRQGNRTGVGRSPSGRGR